MKTFIKLANKIHTYSIIHNNGKFIAESKPFLIEYETATNLPNAEFVKYDILLLFEDINNIEYKIQNNELILKSNYISITLPYIEVSNVPTVDADYFLVLDNIDILQKISDVYSVIEGQIFIRQNKIICEADTISVTIDTGIENSNDAEIELTELFKVTDDYTIIKVAENIITGITRDNIIIHYSI